MMDTANPRAATDFGPHKLQVFKSNYREYNYLNEPKVSLMEL